jgi:hypothetical protein
MRQEKGREGSYRLLIREEWEQWREQRDVAARQEEVWRARAERFGVRLADGKGDGEGRSGRGV